MNLIREAKNYLIGLAPLCDWPEGSQVMENMAGRPSSHWLLPETTCLAAGGTRESARPVVAAIMALHTSIVMVDDVLDQDGRFESLGLSRGEVANLAQGLAFAGINAVLHSPIPSISRELIVNNLATMMTLTAMGQFYDIHRQIQDENAYWQNVQAKSSPFFASAFYVGAVAGGIQADIASQFSELGRLYGELIQIHDDLKDALQKPAAQDWTAGHASLPILYASTVGHPEKDLFLSLRSSINQPDVLLEAQKILLRSGAVSYCAHQLVQRHKLIRQKLNGLVLPNRAPMDTVFDNVVGPVVQMFGKIGAPLPE